MLLCADKAQPCEPSWDDVARAVPAIRVSGRGGFWGSNCPGARTFTGSRGADIDFTLSDLAYDCGWNGVF